MKPCIVFRVRWGMLCAHVITMRSEVFRAFEVVKYYPTEAGVLTTKAIKKSFIVYRRRQKTYRFIIIALYFPAINSRDKFKRKKRKIEDD